MRWDIYTSSALGAVLVCNLWAIYVYIKGKDRPLSKSFALQTSLMGIWCFFPITTSLGGGLGLFLTRIIYVATIFNIPAFTKFSFILVGIYQHRRARKYVRFLFAYSLFLIALLPTQLLMYSTVTLSKHSSIIPGSLFWMFPVSFVITCLYNFYRLIRAYLKAGIVQKNKYKYFIVAFNIAFMGAILHFFPIFSGYSEPFPHDFFLITFVSICAYAIVRYRLMDIRIAISRAVAFLISYPFFLGTAFIFAYRLRPLLYPTFGIHWWLIPSALLVFFATIAPLAYDQLRRGMEGRLLAEQKRYQKLLLQAASGMISEHDLGRLSRLIVYIVRRVVGVSFTGIFLDSPEEQAYSLRAIRFERSQDGNDIVISFPYAHPFIKYAQKYREPFLWEEMPAYVQDAMPNMPAVALIVPAFVEDNLLGFVFLGEKTNRQLYSEDDINVFRILAGQASLAIQNCIFFEESKKAQARIFEAEKLASIGGMADGLAHQIKNRLNHFSVATGELKMEVEFFLKDHPDFLKDPACKKTFDYITQIADSLLVNVKRTDGIVRGILSYARTSEKETFFGEFSLHEVINLSLELLSIKHHVAEVPLIQDVGIDMMFGVKAQIMEAVYNLLDNAYEATQQLKFVLPSEKQKDYAPQMKMLAQERNGSYYIAISDNGIGIKSEDRLKIFAPFFTTKSSYKEAGPGKSGTGIGMYIVKRLIEENHKGKIWFESKYLAGTTFHITLPKRTTDVK